MEMSQVLAPDGTLVGERPIGLDDARDLMAAMVEARIYDRKCSSLQRQGRLATYAPFEGQEAAQIGSATALRPDDWMAATYRDAAAMHAQGYPWVNLLLFRMGDERGGAPPEGIDVLPPSITVGGHMIHAVGLAWAEKIKGSDRAAITYFGDGATSEGDFHEAMNFAAVYDVPCVFVCQNNQYAISLHRSRQTRSETIAAKADAYGMAGVLVDGNDVFAVRQATVEALERARVGDGPTLIEAVTYRLGPHTTADDPGRYRSDEEAEEWRGRDPLDRMRIHLTAEGAWDEGHEAQVAATASAGIEAAVTEAEATPEFPPDGALDRMFETPTGALERQRALLLRDLGE
jgi:pyruvate dehydrogenase E1 component alpha subunit